VARDDAKTPAEPPPSRPSPGDASRGGGTRLAKESIWEVYYPRGVHLDKDALPIASFPMIIYFWPSMIALLLCGALQAATSIAPTSLGLVAVGVWTLNLLVIVTDLDQKKFVITILLVVLLGLGAWVTSLKEVGLVESVAGWFGGLDVRFSTQAYVLMGAILWILFLLGMVQPRFDYWRFEANEFVHYIQPWGRDQSIPRQGSTVTREVPDMLELILTFGGGTLVIRREGQVVARVEHVPFLSRRMIALERLLGATRVKHVTEG
jgi:hypothetical protein